jgi:multimeric flavodoxin WrbA
VQVLLIIGSRNPEGQTAQAVEALARGVLEAGGEVERIYLPTLHIERCRQCQANGWGRCRAEGRCVIEDDFAAIADKVRKAGAVVCATPVYYGELSESLRALLERLRRTCTHEQGRVGIAGKPVIGICVAGGGGGGAPNCCVSLERVLASTGFDVVDLVPARRQNLALKVRVLEVVGQWFATYQPAERK